MVLDSGNRDVTDEVFEFVRVEEVDVPLLDLDDCGLRIVPAVVNEVVGNGVIRDDSEVCDELAVVSGDVVPGEDAVPEVEVAAGLATRALVAGDEPLTVADGTD